MPEIKNIFTSGRMNKDLDERLIPKGEYRDAMNIDVVTSEGSNVGSVQNIKGNTRVDGGAFPTGINLGGDNSQQCVGVAKNDETNSIYFFLYSTKYDAIAECVVDDNGNETINPIFVSKKEAFTGTVNGTTTNSSTVVLDETLDEENIWIGQEVKSAAGNITNEGGEVCTITDINYTTKTITLSSKQSIPDEDTLTFSLNVLQFDPENLITGINYIDGLLLWTDNTSEPKRINIDECSCGTVDWTKHSELHVNGEHLKHGAETKPVKTLEEHITVIKKSPLCAPTLKMSKDKDSNRASSSSSVSFTSKVNDFIDSDNEQRSVGETLIMTFTDCNYKEGDIIRLLAPNSTTNPQDNTSFSVRVKLDRELTTNQFEATILSMDMELATQVVVFDCTLEQGDPFFELVFPRFAYRWKYEDGEYSCFSPFTEVAFLPDRVKSAGGTLEDGEVYHAADGYNLAMENEIKSLLLQKFDTRPKDVVEVDILFKRSNSTNVYTIKTLKEKKELDDVELDPTVTGNEKKGFEVSSEQVHTVIEPNQLLRHWDNVPRKALAQTITKNRLVYGNYLQNFNIPEQPHFSVAVKSSPMVGKLNDPQPSLKSIRTYQVGIVFMDKYGRQSPVFTHNSGVAQISQRNSSTKNQLQVNVTSPSGGTLQLPDWATHYKYFIKEYSNEYYNLALDRYYSADDGNIWLSFPSCERNKLTIDTYLILKKGHGTDAVVLNSENEDKTVKYKILDISDTPPTAISRIKKSLGTIVTSFGKQGTPSIGFPDGGSSSFNVPGADMGTATSPFHSIHLDQLNTKYIRILSNTSGTKIYQVKEIIAKDDPDTGTTSYPLSGEGDYYTIILKEPLGNEVDSVTKTPSGTFNADLTLEIFEEEDDGGKPEFDGRFFVKVNNDVNMQNNIIETSMETKTKTVGCVELIHLGYQHADLMRESDLGNSYIGRKIFTKVGPEDFTNARGNKGIGEKFISRFCLDSAMAYVDATGSGYESWRYLPPLDKQKSGTDMPTDLNDGGPNNPFSIGDWQSEGIGGFGKEERKGSDTKDVSAQGNLRYLACNGGKSLNIRYIGYGQSHDKKKDMESNFSKASLSLGDLQNDVEMSKFDAAIRKPGTMLRFTDDPEQRLHTIEKTDVYPVYNYLDGGVYSTRPNLKDREKEMNSNHGTRYHIRFKDDMIFNPIEPDSTVSYNKGDGTFETSAATHTHGTPVTRLVGYQQKAANKRNSDEQMLTVDEAVGMHTEDKQPNKYYTQICAQEPYTEEGEVLETTNPAIFETEPIEAVDLEIYHEGQCSYPISDLAKTKTVSSTVVPDNGKTLKWYNCFTFGNGIESNRIRDSFNLPFIDDGPKVSTVLAEQYKEEVRGSGMIYSGIINTKAGVNRLNQFSMAEKITKDVNPDYGTIQKLHARNADVVVLCEDKILKVLANKDALFNADGSANITASSNVLGQTIPFAGEFGISKNPESFAAYSFRSYFTDKSRGAVLRLSKDGLTNISEKGMRSYFMDNLATTKVLIGSYDDRKDNYNITLKAKNISTTGATISFTEKADGWTSFKSYIPQFGISMNNRYYTWKQGDMWKHDTNAVYSNFYGTQSGNNSHITLIINENPSTVKNFKTLNYEGTVPQSFTYSGTISGKTITNKTITELVASGYSLTPVSYTHLTLPTKRIV